jgi:hypothetical protein
MKTNQSADTQYATYLVCDAASRMQSGRVREALKLLKHAAILLPDIGHEVQIAAQIEAKNELLVKARGFSA